MTVAAIVLAAGASRRLGQPKQLLLHAGETFLGRAIRLAIDAGGEPVFAVLGAEAERIRAAIPMHNATAVFNQRWEEGIAGSIRAGLQTLNLVEPRSTGVLILGCDQPRLTAGHLRALIETFAAQPEPTIVASEYAKVRGVPAIFPRSVFAELFALRGDQGARALLVRPPCPSIALPFDGGEIDIDEPGDLTHLESL
jgi:CTP:molybdopterin cytidylyltransferase MocA